MEYVKRMYMCLGYVDLRSILYSGLMSIYFFGWVRRSMMRRSELFVRLVALDSVDGVRLAVKTVFPLHSS